MFRFFIGFMMPCVGCQALQADDLDARIYFPSEVLAARVIQAESLFEAMKDNDEDRIKAQLKDFQGQYSYLVDELVTRLALLWPGKCSCFATLKRLGVNLNPIQNESGKLYFGDPLLTRVIDRIPADADEAGDFQPLVLRELLKNDVDPNQVNEVTGWHPLFMAVHTGMPEIVELLIKSGANVHYKCPAGKIFAGLTAIDVVPIGPLEFYTGIDPRSPILKQGYWPWMRPGIDPLSPGAVTEWDDEKMTKTHATMRTLKLLLNRGADVTAVAKRIDSLEPRIPFNKTVKAQLWSVVIWHVWCSKVTQKHLKQIGPQNVPKVFEFVGQENPINAWSSSFVQGATPLSGSIPADSAPVVDDDRTRPEGRSLRQWDALCAGGDCDQTGAGSGSGPGPSLRADDRFIDVAQGVVGPLSRRGVMPERLQWMPELQRYIGDFSLVHKYLLNRQKTFKSNYVRFDNFIGISGMGRRLVDFTRYDPNGHPCNRTKFMTYDGVNQHAHVYAGVHGQERS